jgi:HEAT repeat protein
MLRVGKTGLNIGLALGFLLLTGFESGSFTTNKKVAEDPIARHIAVLRSGSAQEKAAAAYWLGRQHSAAAPAVDPLVDLLGDSSEINPTRYRGSKILQKLTLGEEAAAALVNIGHPSIEPLIRVLKTSPFAEARKNAAWALGALHDSGVTTSQEL